MRETIWKVTDNSGIETVKQLKIERSKSEQAKPGDILVVFPQKFGYIKVIKRQKYYGLVVSLRKKIRRKSASYIQATVNSVLIFNQQKKFLGSKIFGPVYKEFRKRRASYIYKRVYARVGYFI